MNYVYHSENRNSIKILNKGLVMAKTMVFLVYSYALMSFDSPTLYRNTDVILKMLTFPSRFHITVKYRVPFQKGSFQENYNFLIC